MKEVYEKEFEVMLKDIDKNNKMRLSSYLNFMQEIGAFHSAEFGYGINDEPKTHKAWIVTAWDLKIFRRPKWNEKIFMRSWIGKIDKLYHYRDYEVLDSENNVIAKAVAQWVMVDTITKKIQIADKNMIEKFPVVTREDFDNVIPKVSTKINIEELEKIYECKVQKRDVDTNNHMNNIIYLDLALEGLDDEYIDNVSEIQIYYKAECKYEDEIVFMKDKDNKVYILEKNKEKLHTVVVLK